MIKYAHNYNNGILITQSKHSTDCLPEKWSSNSKPYRGQFSRWSSGSDAQQDVRLSWCIPEPGSSKIASAILSNTR